MPRVIIGCGTGYYTRANEHGGTGTCTFCKRSTTLRSYDTRLFGVILFVPIIPLGRKRIVDQCSSCRRESVVQGGKWQEMMAKGREAVAAYMRTPLNSELALSAVQSCVALRDRAGFVPLAVQIEKSLPRDMKVMAQTAEAYVFFDLPRDAERVLRLSLELNDSDPTSEALADVLIQQGRPDEAEPYLEHIVTDRLVAGTNNLFALSLGYLRKGNQDSALRVFQKCKMLQPQLEQDDTVAQRWAEAGQPQATSKPMDAEKLRRDTAGKARWALLMFASVAAVVVLSIYSAVSIYQGGHEKVYLVSGMQQAYTVKINGVAYTLQPWTETEIHLHDGVNRLHFVSPPLPIADEDFTLHVPFWGRPMSSTEIVVNPDRSVIVDKVTVFYKPENEPGKDSEMELHTGDVVRTYDGVDYSFVEPPKTLDMNGSTELAKKCLKLVDRQGHSTTSLLETLEENGTISTATLTDICRRRVSLEPDDDESLTVLEQNLPPDDLLALLKSGLARRPLAIDWHRSYQGISQQAGHTDALIAEYQGMLDKDPQNPELMYLLSRVVKDPDDALVLLHKATAAKTPSAYAFYSLAGAMLENGKFHEAVTDAETAIQMKPDSQEFPAMLDMAEMADGRAGDVLSRATKDEGDPSGGILLAALAGAESEMTCDAILNRRSDADAVHTRLVERAKKEKEKVEILDELIAEMPGEVAYMFGDPAGLKVGVDAKSEANVRFTADVSNGAVADAEKDLSQVTQPDALAYLDLYLAAMQAGNTDIAERAMKSAIEKLGKGTPEEQQYAAAFGGTSTMPVDKLLKLRCAVPEKVVVITALGVRQTSMRDAALALARKLNYNPRFPHLLVQAALDKG